MVDIGKCSLWFLSLWPYTEPVFELLLGRHWEASVEYSRFLENLFGELDGIGVGDFGLKAFLLDGADLGIAEDIVGYALIFENSVEIKALGLASSEEAS